jgi:hypothetical protein
MDYIGDRLKAAIDHVNTLREESDSRLKQEASGPSHDFDSEPGYVIVRGGPPPDTVPPSYGIHIGQALYQFRAALNNLVCELARLNHQPVDDDMEFPIFSHAAKFGDRKNLRSSSGRRIGKLTEAQQTLIEWEQPYNAYPNTPDDDPLWWLHQLSNFDRHKALHVTVTWIRSNATVINPAIALLEPVSVQLGRYDPHAEIARYRIINPGPSVEVEFHSSVQWDIAFAPETPPPLAGKLVFRTLGEIGMRVPELIGRLL